MTSFHLTAVLLFLVSCQAEPDSQTMFPPLISFKDGIIGVNFLGFHAAAGIGTNGRLHAEAGTPFGQRAAAGLNGAMGSNGRLGGSLYAGATAGGNVKAAAGLGGELGNDGVNGGTLYSGASAGNARAGTSLGGDSRNGFTKTVINNGGVEADKRIQFAIPPPAHMEEPPKPHEIHQMMHEMHHMNHIHREPQIDQRMSIPEADEKISNETPKKPQNDEKVSNETPKEPAISNDVGGEVVIKKVTHVRGHPVKFDRFLNHKVIVEENRKADEEQRPLRFRKRVQLETIPYEVQENVHQDNQDNHDTPVMDHDSPANYGSNFLKDFLGGGAIGGGFVATAPRYPKSPESETSHTVTATVHKNPSFFEDIFNIPISTLGAVSKFLSNSAGSVQKTVTVEHEHH